MQSAVESTELYPRTTAYCNSDGRFAQIASWQYCSMVWPTLLDCRLRELDAIIARQPGKRRLERIPVNEAAPDHASHIVSAWTPDLASVPEEAWQKAVKRFKILKPLLNMGNSGVVEEVNLQCFNSKIKGKPAPNTIRARVSVLSDRLKLGLHKGSRDKTQ